MILNPIFDAADQLNHLQRPIGHPVRYGLSAIDADGVPYLPYRVSDSHAVQSCNKPLRRTRACQEAALRRQARQTNSSHGLPRECPPQTHLCLSSPTGLTRLLCVQPMEDFKAYQS
jgi:hypothetical protein